MTLVTLLPVTDAVTMQGSSLGGNSAVKYTKILTALACALLAVSLLGCGTTNKLQTITLTASLINGQAPSGQTGIYNLEGDGGTIQLVATGEYTSGKTQDLSNVVKWQAIIDPNYTQDAYGAPLLPPCSPPSCPVPTAPPYTQGTLEFNQTGLITAVEPAKCTWVEQGTGWFFVGAYQVTATYGGIVSQPIYIPIASEAGPAPNGACGPTTSS
jgi:hypothetical protein